MRMRLHLDEEQIRTAARLTGIIEKTALVRFGLEALVARESSRRLTALGGTKPKLASIPRRRPKTSA